MVFAQWLGSSPRIPFPASRRPQREVDLVVDIARDQPRTRRGRPVMLRSRGSHTLAHAEVA